MFDGAHRNLGVTGMSNVEFERVIALVGSQPALARLLGTSQQHINRLKKLPHLNANWTVLLHAALRRAYPDFVLDIAALCPELKGWTPPADAPDAAPPTEDHDP